MSTYRATFSTYPVRYTFPIPRRYGRGSSDGRSVEEYKSLDLRNAQEIHKIYVQEIVYVLNIYKRGSKNEHKFKGKITKSFPSLRIKTTSGYTVEK